MSKTYRFNVRKIVSCTMEINADSKEDALIELEDQLLRESRDMDNYLDDEVGIDFLVGADAKLEGKSRWKTILPNRCYKIVESEIK